jgi:hypothetical protein
VTSFLFLRATLPRLRCRRERWTRGEPRIVRFEAPRCRFLPLAQVCPTAMPLRLRPPKPHPLAWRGPDERDARAEGPSKDVSPGARRHSRDVVSGAHAFRMREPTTFPSSAPFGHPPVVGATFATGGTHDDLRTDLGLAFRRNPAKGSRHPEDQGAFCRLSATQACERIAPPRNLRRPPPHAAHTLPPRLGKVFWMGIASVTAPLPGLRDVRECERLFRPRVTAPGTDDPSTPA